VALYLLPFVVVTASVVKSREELSDMDKVISLASSDEVALSWMHPARRFDF
jgi:hypothetical protein